MPKTDVTARSLVINKLNKAQFNAAEKSDTELYFVTDDTTYEETANKSDSYTASSSSTYASTKALVDGLATKENVITGAASTVTSSNLTASRVVISNANGKIAASDITTTELNYLDNATGNIQTQLNNLDTNKADKATTLAGYGITNAYTKDEVDEKVAGVYIYKGSVATQVDLPASGNRTGDVYNVESDGTNWAWNGTAWDNLGALIDLSVKQDVLVSGENIKTINNNSILGSGNMSLPVTISELTDTTIASLANDQFLRYDSATSKWKNTTVHIPADANNATITIKDADTTVIGDFTTDQSTAETITIPTATTSKFGLVKVDSALSDSSVNPVQNKVINTALSQKQNNLDANQLAAVNSGITDTLVAKIGTNETAISTINNSAVMNSGITSEAVTNYNTHLANTNIHVTSAQKSTWDAKQEALVSGTNIKTVNGNSLLGSGNVDTFPSQTGNNGKFLSTNGTTVSWESVDAFPVQTGNAGKVLKTDGSDVSWDVIGNSGDVIPFGTSTSAADATQKNVTISSITALNEGQIIIVQPTITSTVANSTIKLNSFDPYPMRYNDAAITTSTDSIVWTAGVPSWWRFDGTYWVFIGHGIDNNTEYAAMPINEGTTGSATTLRTVRADYLKQIIQGTTLTNIDVTTTGTVSASDTITSAIGKLQASKQENLVSGTNIKTVDGVSILGSGDIDIIPTQTGNSGKFLTTNGTAVSWGEIVEYTAAEVDTLWDSITPTAA